MHVRVCAHVHAHMLILVRMHAPMHIRTHKHTHTRTHARTQEGLCLADNERRLTITGTLPASWGTSFLQNLSHSDPQGNPNTVLSNNLLEGTIPQSSHGGPQQE